MSIPKTFSSDAIETSQALRRIAAASLRSASAALARMSRRLYRPPPARSNPLQQAFEFYAEAGAPEGALYRDGQLVGWIAGVRRL